MIVMNKLGRQKLIGKGISFSLGEKKEILEWALCELYLVWSNKLSADRSLHTCSVNDQRWDTLDLVGHRLSPSHSIFGFLFYDPFKI